MIETGIVLQTRSNRLKPAGPKLARLVSILVFAVQAGLAPAQTSPAAWPDPLILLNGHTVHDAATFQSQRRPEILRLFEENVYGRTPQDHIPKSVRITSTDDHALGGTAIRRQITVTFGDSIRRQMHILLYLPAHAAHTVPVFIGLNFSGNQTVNSDPGIDLPAVWIPDPALKSTPIAGELAGHILQPALEESRGKASSEWQLPLILSRGYGLATVYAGDLEPDFATGIGYGIRPLFLGEKRLPSADDWGAIGAWAWGMSRIADYLATDPAVDRGKLIAIGHSRFGKTALWAAAQDPRFAVVISNESGQGGATLSHRQVDESIAHLNIAFPYWFCANYHHYTGRTDQLPVDGHLLLALIARRPLYVASAQDDHFSDPEGEFLAARAASPVYELYGRQGIAAGAPMPAANHPIGRDLRYHIRSGGHDITAYDWQQYLDFADQAFAHQGATPHNAARPAAAP